MTRRELLGAGAFGAVAGGEQPPSTACTTGTSATACRSPLGRSADGRYGLVYMFTRLILRTDAVPDFIGLPYDQRA